MARTIFKSRKRAQSASFFRFEHRMLNDPSFLALSGAAAKVLLFLAGQYNGSNNGDLSLAIKVARKAGMPGSSNLRRAAKELIEAGFVILTRQGGKHRCSLYALSWFPIDECDGKLDAGISATKAAPNNWLWNGRNRAPPEAQCAPPEAQSAQNSAPWSAN